MPNILKIIDFKPQLKETGKVRTRDLLYPWNDHVLWNNHELWLEGKDQGRYPEIEAINDTKPNLESIKDF
jgi:hypothetical protein